MTDPINSTAVPAFSSGESRPAFLRLPSADAAASVDAHGPVTGIANGPAPDVPAGKAPGADMQAVTDALNAKAQELQTSLRFQIDKTTGRTVISVIDDLDGKVLIQIPDEEALAVAQSLQRMQAQLVQQRA